MRKLFRLFVLLAVVFTALNGTGRAETASPLTLNETHRASRVSFETNVGQTNSNVKFLSRQAGFTLFLTSNEAVLALKKISTGRAGPLRMKWIGANTRSLRSAALYRHRQSICCHRLKTPTRLPGRQACLMRDTPCSITMKQQPAALTRTTSL